jgi:hypothetical protein
MSDFLSPVNICSVTVKHESRRTHSLSDIADVVSMKLVALLFAHPGTLFLALACLLLQVIQYIHMT